MIYIIDLDAYGLMLKGEKIFINYINKYQCFALYIWKGFIIIQKYICILLLMTKYECKLIYIYIFLLKFLSLKLYLYCLFWKRTCV
jgi:hypothetical protein